MEQLFGVTILVHLAGIVYVAGFLSRDQLVLRSLLFTGGCLYIAFYFFTGPTPMWEAILWSIIFLVANLYVMIGLFLDQRHRALSQDEQRLLSLFSALTPGEFRRLMKTGRWVSPAEPATLTCEGRRPDSLFFVLDGDVTISKGERRFSINPGLFIGEIAWLLGTPATATVEVPAGARYIEWDTKHLDVLFTRNPSLRIAFEGMLNRDLAGKLGKA